MTKGPNHLVLHCFGTLTQKRRLVFVTLLNWVNVQMSKQGKFIKEVSLPPKNHFSLSLLDNAPD